MADILDILNQALHLDEIVIWLPSAKTVAAITTTVLFLRRLLAIDAFKNIFNKVTDGKGVLLLVGIVTFLSEVLPKLDNGLTVYEAALCLLSTGLLSVINWELVKRFTKHFSSGQ